MKFILSLVVFASLLTLGTSCQKEVIKEVIVTDTLTVRDTLVVTDTVYLRDSSLKCGLLAYYPFTGNFNDASGNGNHLTAVNGTLLGADTAGTASSSALFDGVNDYLIVHDGGKIYSDTITISMLFNANDWSSVRTLIARHNFDNAAGFNFGIAQSTANTKILNFAVGNESLGCSTTQETDSSIGVVSNTSTETGKWHHLMASFAGGEIKFYVNGQLVGSKIQPYQNSNDCVEASLVIGGWWKSYMYTFSGRIDEVRIYDRLLSDCEKGYLSKL